MNITVLSERAMELAATEVANGKMTCREAAAHFYVDQAVLVHKAKAKQKAMFDGQRIGTYRIK